MTSVESIKRQINTCKDLQSVVKTMKALAALSLRQYEKAVEALVDYTRTVEMGLQVVLHHQNPNKLNSKLDQEGVGMIIFGSDQGMCGQFNDQIVQYTLKHLKTLETPPENQKIITIGSRLISFLETANIEINQQFFIPGSVNGITTLIQEILVTIDQWQQQKPIERLLLFYNQPHKKNVYIPVIKQLLPLDHTWLAQLQKSH
jgi:F-type H+-transporting ATPase subunit gamma